MTTPQIPHRVEFSVEVRGTPEQVWAAIATADGISSWFLPTRMEGREGGAIVAEMGETESPGIVTRWDPPTHFAYEEPEWAALAGHEGEPVGPMINEFLVEAQSGGTCVVRVVASAFGTGADWEDEFFDDMVAYWRPYLDLLRLYLERFPGQRATTLGADADVAAGPSKVRAAIDRALGAGEVGSPVEVLGLSGRVERSDDIWVHLGVTAPVPGYLALFVLDKGDGVTSAVVMGWLFGEGAAELVEAQEPAWRDWLKSLPLADHEPAARR